MSQKIRIGNIYHHSGKDTEVIVTHHDSGNFIWYRKVLSRDNAGVISTDEGVYQERYDEFLGNVEMRDYPDDWTDLAAAVRKRDDHICQGCGVDGDDHDGNLSVHHIVPLGCGGTNTYRNLITLCSECHGNIHGGPI